jgi:hypothetical protein
MLFGKGTVGMATLENMIYVMVATYSGGPKIGLVTCISRALLALPLHASTSVLIASDVARLLQVM